MSRRPKQVAPAIGAVTADPRIAAAVAAVPVAAPVDPASIARARVPPGLARTAHGAWQAPRWPVDAIRAFFVKNPTP